MKHCLVVSDHPILKILEIPGNGLENKELSLVIDDASALEKLDITNTRLNTLQLPKILPKLKVFTANRSSLTNAQLAQVLKAAPALEELNLFSTNITHLDLSKNPKLKIVDAAMTDIPKEELRLK